MPLPEDLRPTPLEQAAGTVFGWSPPAPLPDVPVSLTPLDALEEAVVPLLERGRLFVAFSGGRDSSAVLALAVRAARRRGLGDPIPLTLRFPGADGADESEWQEEVVAHLGVREWERIELGDELDLLGPLARSLIGRHGPWWPPNAHAYAPLFAAARGGSVITGMDGDGLLGGWRWRRAAAVLAGRRRPELRDVLRIGRAYAPGAVKRAVVLRVERPFALPWLTPAAARAASRAYARQFDGEPVSWRRRVARYYLGQRHLAVISASLAAVASDHAVDLRHPLMDERFLATLAREGGRAGYESRTAAMAALFGDLVTERVVNRVGKADFTWAFWGPESRRFAEAWSGVGADPRLVDGAALREAWLAPKPDIRSALLLQAAWRADSGLEAEDRLDDEVE